MKTFLVEITVDVDDDELTTERDIENFFHNIDPSFGIVTVESVTEQ